MSEHNPIWAASVAALLLASGCGHSGGAVTFREAQNSCPASPVLEVPSPRLPEGPQIPAADLRSDFDAWMTGMQEIHPDIFLRADRPGFNRTRAEIEEALTRPLSEREAWLLFARLNPFLRDGHNGVLLSDYRQRLRDHLARGGRAAPFEAHFDDDGALRVRALAEPAQGLSVGARILSINGRDADQIVEAMLAVTEGDTPAFRRALSARRFQFLYWTLFGDTGDYVIEVENGGCPRTIVVEGARRVPTPTAESEFSYDILDGGIGYIRAGSFGGEHQQAFADFSRRAFTEFKARGVRALIIDVRDNGGGDDPLWQESLMEYVTTRPYVHVGAYAVRITAENAGPGDVIGAVRRTTYDRRFIPTPGNPLRMDAPVYVLKGPFTYSAAIQFVVAAQDFGIARIAGPESGALSCQTGRVTSIPLPKTGFNAFTPLMTFTRPSGAGCDRPVTPDILIDDDGLIPSRAVDILAECIRAGQTLAPACPVLPSDAARSQTTPGV